MKQWRVGIIGATGMVGQRFIGLLHNHPWFRVTALAASARSAGQTYGQAVAGRWAMPYALPEYARHMTLLDADQVEAIAAQVDFVFCAVSLDKAATRALEERYAQAEVPVLSNNSACRGLPDVPMIIPELNAAHAAIIPAQRRRLGTRIGFIAVKPNCSIQSYVPALTPLQGFGIQAVSACTYQAVSGAGKTLEGWPEMADNVIPYIGGEEEKSEQEPLKIWGILSEDGTAIRSASEPVISAQCLRVPVSDGHMAAVSVKFTRKPTREQMLQAWAEMPAADLPTAPRPFLKYFEENDRPQTKLDRDLGGGMAVSIGRLREDPLMDWRFVCLSHNTLRGAAGGNLLTAELLCRDGWIPTEDER